MGHIPRPRLVDAQGNLLDSRIENALARLSQRFTRTFPSIQDDAVRAEIFEEAARRLTVRESRDGALDRLHGYAWVTLRSVAASWMRKGSSKLSQYTLPRHKSETLLARLASRSDAASAVERRILLRQLLSHLSEDERMVCVWKAAGYSSEEIALRRGGTAAAVDTAYSRAKQKLRVALGEGEGQALQPPERTTDPLESRRPHPVQRPPARRFTSAAAFTKSWERPSPQRVGATRQ